ncbi:unnamed protein product [Prunus armeniaca]
MSRNCMPKPNVSVVVQGFCQVLVLKQNCRGTVGEDESVQPVQKEQHVLLILVLLSTELPQIIRERTVLVDCGWRDSERLGQFFLVLSSMIVTNSINKPSNINKPYPARLVSSGPHQNQRYSWQNSINKGQRQAGSHPC